MCNRYAYEDLEIGDFQSFQVIITKEAVDSFCNISGDKNPLHLNSEYAREKGFADRVVYGMLTSSYYSRLIGVYLPGERCLLQEMEVKYKYPAYIGDVLQVKGTITEKHDVFSQIVIKAEIRRESDGKKLSQAKIKVGVL